MIHMVYAQAEEKREIVGNNLVIIDSVSTTVTVLGGPESMSDYWASFNIFEEYKHVFIKNAANKDWMKKYDHQSLSETLGKLVRQHIPAEYLPRKGRINISCAVSLSGRIDMITYFVKKPETMRWVACHREIPAEVYVKLDKAIKENIRFPSWKDEVPYKFPTIVWCYSHEEQ
ncbi:MAG: hypothetical protein NC308_04285 [Clostridium sp.]|nr:hypothetical protein [Bacteroides sp.]MCM1198085.1 hypothetical protein [Clostridium sp.]